MVKNFLMKSMESANAGSVLKVRTEELKESLAEAFAATEKDVTEEVKLFEQVHIYEVSVDEDALNEIYKTTDNPDEELIEAVVVTEVTKETLDKDIRQNMNTYISGNRYLRMAAAKRGYGLDRLCDDEDVNIRCEIVEQGYRLDKMIEDPSKIVRIAVAKAGYGLDILVKDPSSYVRAEVARQNYGLDELSDDLDSYVRVAVADTVSEDCTDILEKLSEDENEYVREHVAKRGYALGKLMNDLARRVREAVCEKADDNILSVLVHDDSEHVKEAVAKRGYGLAELADNESSYVKAEVARNITEKTEGREEILEKLSKDENWHVRLEVAKHGYEPCLKDSNPAVRKAAYDKIHETKEEAVNTKD